MSTEKIGNWTFIRPLTLDLSNASVVQRPNVEMVWRDPKSLVVDHSYQRKLSRKSIKLIASIVNDWAWEKFKPPILITVDTLEHIIDGQHTAIAAATNPYIAQIPCLLFKDSLTLAQRADAFVGQNINRTEVTALAIFEARLESGDEESIGVSMALRAAKVTLTNGGFVATGECNISSIKTLLKLYRKYGLEKLKTALIACRRANLTTIPASHLWAVSDLLYGVTAGQYDDEALSLTIQDYSPAKFMGDVVAKSQELGIRQTAAATLVLSRLYRDRFPLLPAKKMR